MEGDMTWQDVYWLTRFDAINTAMTVMCVAFGITAIVLLIIGLINRYDGYSAEDIKLGARVLKIATGFGVATLATMLLFVFIPTTKEAAVIYILPKVVNNEQVQKIPAEGLKILEAKFDEWLDGMTKKETEKP
jgi:hypothetical protein